MAASGVIQKADFKIVYVAPMKASSVARLPWVVWEYCRTW